MTDLSTSLIDIFPNINDLPRLPTAQKAGNVSHLIQLHNRLTTELTTAVTDLEDRTALLEISKESATVGGNRVVFEDSTVQAGENIVVVNYFNINIDLFLASPHAAAGQEIRFMHMNPQGRITIKRESGSPFKYKRGDVTEVRYSQSYEWASLIYVGYSSKDDVDIGWVPIKDNLLLATPYYPPSSGS